MCAGIKDSQPFLSVLCKKTMFEIEEIYFLRNRYVFDLFLLIVNCLLLEIPAERILIRSKYSKYCFAISYSSLKNALEAGRYFYFRACFIIFIRMSNLDRRDRLVVAYLQFIPLVRHIPLPVSFLDHVHDSSSRMEALALSSRICW